MANVRKMLAVVVAVVLVGILSVPVFAAPIYSEDFSDTIAPPNGYPTGWTDMGKAVGASGTEATMECKDGSLQWGYSQFNQSRMVYSNSGWTENNFTISLSTRQDKGASSSAEAIATYWFGIPSDEGVLQKGDGYSLNWYQEPGGRDYFNVRKYADSSIVSSGTGGWTSTLDPGFTGNAQHILAFSQFHKFEMEVAIVNDDVTIVAYVTPNGGTRTKMFTATDTETPYLAMTGVGMSVHSRNSNPNYLSTTFLDYVEVIPEPTTLGLLAMGGLGCLIRRKR